MFAVIVSPEGGFQNVTEWCKKEICWSNHSNPIFGVPHSDTPISPDTRQLGDAWYVSRHFDNVPLWPR
jgi:hypothetical protein